MKKYIIIQCIVLMVLMMISVILAAHIPNYIPHMLYALGIITIIIGGSIFRYTTPEKERKSHSVFCFMLPFYPLIYYVAIWLYGYPVGEYMRKGIMPFSWFGISGLIALFILPLLSAFLSNRISKVVKGS